MEKVMACVNVLFLALSLAGAAYYEAVGGLRMKALSAGVFALLGLINGAYALKMRRFNPLYMCLALLVCMTADIVLGYSFVAGAGVFALGHVLYFTAFCRMEKLRLADLMPGMLLFITTARSRSLDLF